MDEIIQLLQLHIKKQKSIEDPDCPSGVCGSGGREWSSYWEEINLTFLKYSYILITEDNNYEK